MAGLGTSGLLSSRLIYRRSLRGRHPESAPGRLGGRLAQSARPPGLDVDTRGPGRAAAWSFLAYCHFIHEALAFDKRISLVHRYRAASCLTIRPKTRP